MSTFHRRYFPHYDFTSLLILACAFHTHFSTSEKLRAPRFSSTLVPQRFEILLDKCKMLTVYKYDKEDISKMIRFKQTHLSSTKNNPLTKSYNDGLHLFT